MATTDPTQSERVSLLEQAHKLLMDDVIDIKLTLRNINDRLSQRPSWTVTTYITIMTAMSAGLLGWVLAAR